MAKPELKYEAGILTVKASVAQVVDADKDGKASLKVTADFLAEVDAVEVISEIAKKDYPLVEAILKSIKV
jgi:hypothetical protein